MRQGKPGFLAVDALDPDDPGEVVEVCFPLDLVNDLYKTHPVDWYNVRVAKEVLECPERVYSGTREHQEGGWCYVGRPTSYCMKPDVTVPLPPGFVFTVYLNAARTAYHWRIEKTEPQDELAPIGADERYGRLAWDRDS